MGASSHVLPLCVVILAVTVTFLELLSPERRWLYVLDDGDNFINNPYVLGLSRENVEWAFRDGALLGVYEPFGTHVDCPPQPFFDFVLI